MSVTLEKSEIQDMLDQAAMKVFTNVTLYHMTDAARLMGISYNTLQKRIQERKITVVDGRITGAEISRYLKITQ